MTINNSIDLRSRQDIAADTRYQPIFVGGAGRSGTTLLRVMLASHPSLCGGPEFKLIPDIAKLYRTMKYLPDVMNFYGVSREAAGQRFAEFITNFFEPFRAENEGKRLVEKTPHNVLFMNELAEILPHAKFIHIVRDGRDVACSLVKMDWRTPDGMPIWYVQNRENAFRYWVDIVTAGLQQAAQSHAQGRVFLLRYEDLIASPEIVLRSLLRFLGEPWSETVLSYNKQNKREEPVESSTAQVAKDLYQTSRQRWRVETTEDEVRVFKQIGGELLIRLGYEVDLNW